MSIVAILIGGSLLLVLILKVFRFLIKDNGKDTE